MEMHVALRRPIWVWTGADSDQNVYQLTEEEDDELGPRRVAPLRLGQNGTAFYALVERDHDASTTIVQLPPAPPAAAPPDAEAAAAADTPRVADAAPPPDLKEALITELTQGLALIRGAQFSFARCHRTAIRLTARRALSLPRSPSQTWRSGARRTRWSSTCPRTRSRSSSCSSG
jgi:hypothetical protein